MVRGAVWLPGDSSMNQNEGSSMNKYSMYLHYHVLLHLVLCNTWGMVGIQQAAIHGGTLESNMPEAARSFKDQLVGRRQAESFVGELLTSSAKEGIRNSVS